METIYVSETSGVFRATRHCNPEERAVHSGRCDNLHVTRRSTQLDTMCGCLELSL
jgi:hypothetical protein